MMEWLCKFLLKIPYIHYGASLLDLLQIAPVFSNGAARRSLSQKDLNYKEDLNYEINIIAQVFSTCAHRIYSSAIFHNASLFDLCVIKKESISRRPYSQYSYCTEHSLNTRYFDNQNIHLHHQAHQHPIA